MLLVSCGSAEALLQNGQAQRLQCVSILAITWILWPPGTGKKKGGRMAGPCDSPYSLCMDMAYAISPHTLLAKASHMAKLDISDSAKHSPSITNNDVRFWGSDIINISHPCYLKVDICDRKLNPNWLKQKRVPYWLGLMKSPWPCRYDLAQTFNDVIRTQSTSTSAPPPSFTYAVLYAGFIVKMAAHSTWLIAQ